MREIEIKISAYSAVNILSFLREFINAEELGEDYQFATIQESVDAYELEVLCKVNEADWEEIRAQVAIDRLIGKVPQNKK